MDEPDQGPLPQLPDDAVFDALAAIRSGAAASKGIHPTLLELISSCPRILTRRWLDAHKEHPDVSMLLDVASSIAAYREPWPWGLGPLERIFGELDKGFGLKAAQELACSSEVTAALSPSYLEAATGFIFQFLEAGNLQAAARRHEILLAAVDQEGLEDPAACRRRIWAGWLDVAGRLLGEFHDERIFGLAVMKDDALSALAQNDPEMQADIAYRFVGLLLAPLVSLSGGFERLERETGARVARGPAYPIRIQSTPWRSRSRRQPTRSTWRNNACEPRWR